MGDYTVKVTVGDVTVEVRGAGDELVEIATALIERLPRPNRLALPPGGGAGRDQPRMDDRETDQKTPEGASKPIDPKTFFTEKNPSTHVEAGVTAGYYLTFLAPPDERLETFGSDDVIEIFRKVNRKLPARTAQVLVDAHGAGYLDRAAQGKYKLNTVGENLVSHTLGADS